MHEFMVFPDDTIVVYSDKFEDGCFDVIFERPTSTGFDTLKVSMPTFTLIQRRGFTDAEVEKYREYMKYAYDLISFLAGQGGIKGYLGMDWHYYRTTVSALTKLQAVKGALAEHGVNFCALYRNKVDPDKYLINLSNGKEGSVEAHVERDVGLNSFRVELKIDDSLMP